MRNAVHIGMEPYLAIANGRNALEDFEFLMSSADAMLDELAWWSQALMTARAAPGETGLMLAGHGLETPNHGD